MRHLLGVGHEVHFVHVREMYRLSLFLCVVFKKNVIRVAGFLDSTFTESLSQNQNWFRDWTGKRMKILRVYESFDFLFFHRRWLLPMRGNWGCRIQIPKPSQKVVDIYVRGQMWIPIIYDYRTIILAKVQVWKNSFNFQPIINSIGIAIRSLTSVLSCLCHWQASNFKIKLIYLSCCC